MIQFLDLKTINEPYEAAFQEKLKAVLDSGWYILSNEVKGFESNFAISCGIKYCIGVGNGFDALVLIFKGNIQIGKLENREDRVQYEVKLLKQLANSLKTKNLDETNLKQSRNFFQLYSQIGQTASDFSEKNPQKKTN